MMQIIRNCPVQRKKHAVIPFNTLMEAARMVQELPALDDDAASGDCVEVDFHPEAFRYELNKRRVSIIVRQTSTTTWRIWRRKS